MGLDWRPLPKSNPGFEDRYHQIFRILCRNEKENISVWDKLKGKKAIPTEQLVAEFHANTIPSYVAIRAPMVGRDEAANEWARAQYEQSDRQLTEAAFLEQLQGYYVIELAPEEDGVPMYSAMGQDANVFRGQFLKDCEDLLGKQLLNEAWESKLAPETLQYGQEMMAIAENAAHKHNLSYLKDQRSPPETDPGTIESKLHILFSAAKWLIFYGKQGHGYEADF